MKNYFAKYPLYEVTKKLADVAMGRDYADLVILHSKLINVCTHEIQEDMGVIVKCGRIAYIGKDPSFSIGENTKVIDAAGKYLAPSFLDGHMHVESSMLSVGEYAKAVIPHGTSGIFFDPHEICNVLGMKGVRYMLDDAKRTPLKSMLTMPSCVPAVEGFEDTGAKITSREIKEAMEWNETVGLGEMMNFPGILYSNPETHAIVGETLKADKCPTGHYSVPETDQGLNAYVASGIRNCHESVREIDALSKMRLGMYAQLREGSAWHDLIEVSKAITKHEVDARFAQLISDDSHPRTLVDVGHLDNIVKKAIEYGIDPITAIQMVTINTATCYQLEHEIGSIAPSKCADMVLISDLQNMIISDVFIDGEHVAKDGKLIVEFEDYSYPSDAYNTVHLDLLTEEDFLFQSDEKAVKVRCIEAIGGKTITNEVIEELPVVNGNIAPDASRDILKMMVFERHNRTGNVGRGFLKGFGIKSGALAQTVGHDAHNLSVVGTNEKDMVLAANTLISCGGGSCVVKDGKVIALVELPLAGLMSETPVKEMKEKTEKLEKSWVEIGCNLPSPFMTMGIIPLAVIPSLRLTNRGLVDVNKFQFVPLIVK